MNRAFYSKRHFDRISNGRPDTAETIAERLRHREACAQAVREREQRFAVLTAENVAEAIAWQEARIAELLRMAS